MLYLLEQIVFLLPLLFGAYVSMSLMKISNLGIESAYLFGAVLASKLVLQGYNGPGALLLVLCASAAGGALVGFVAASFAQKAEFSHVLSAIITVGLFQGLVLMLLDSAPLSLASTYNPLQVLPSFAQYPELTTAGVIVLGITCFFFLFLKTQLGISCAVYGHNNLFLKNYRIDQTYVVIAGMMLSNASAGISGYFIAQSRGFVDMYMGKGISLLCLSALILGKSIHRSSDPIVPSIPIWSTIGYVVIQTVLLQLGFDLQYLIFAQAVLLAVMLLFSSRFSKEFLRKDLLGV